MYTRKLVQRLRYNIRPAKSMEYTGCNAFNLGDQAVFKAIVRLFSGITVAYPKNPGGVLGRAVSRWETRQRRLASILGGGTQIGASWWSVPLVTAYEQSLNRTGLGFAFGTGVAENDFPADHEFYVADKSTYEKWGDLLRRSHYVGVRGPRSRAALEELGVTSEVIGDPACAYVKAEGFWRPQPRRLGLNVGHGGGSMWGDRGEFNAKMGRFVAEATSQGWKIDFFALMDDDVDIIKDVARMGGITNPRIFCEYFDPDRYLARVGMMQAFIGMKLHSVILSTCAHVPSIMLEYRPKGIDFMESIGMEEFNVRTSDVEPEALLDSLSRLVDRGPHWSEKIRRSLAAYKSLQETRARELITLASELARRKPLRARPLAPASAAQGAA
jgi:hypothetical protein